MGVATGVSAGRERSALKSFSDAWGSLRRVRRIVRQMRACSTWGSSSRSKTPGLALLLNSLLQMSR
jgi:hypothetical protein